jgi:hypothetical protein
MTTIEGTTCDHQTLANRAVRVAAELPANGASTHDLLLLASDLLALAAENEGDAVRSGTLCSLSVRTFLVSLDIDKGAL